MKYVLVLLICAAPAMGADPFTKAKAALALSADPFKAPVKAGCSCGCPCAECPGESCECGCPCAALTYYRYADGCTYEFQGAKFTGVAWDAAGRKWVKGALVNPPRVVAMAACSS